MKQALAAIALIATLTVAGFQAATPALAAEAKQRVVIQVSDNDPKKWNLALNNAQNVTQALGKDNVQVEIVAYGPGLNMLKADSKVAGRLNGALDGGVGLMACGNTMKKMKVTQDDLAGGVTMVQAGVIHIMKRQGEGWAYVRP
jgi:intracellular sulfur oxidation DsrE/DsrF family protein